MKVLVACEFSQVVTKEFRKLGHEACSCDLLPTEGNPDWHIQDDIVNHLSDNWDMLIAHPPCTFLCGTAAKWFYDPADKHLPIEERRPHPKFPNRKQDRSTAFEFFMALVNAPIPKIAIENPVGVMSTYWRKPDQIIQPYEFGHPEPKKTCLWLKNLPKLKPTKIVEPEYTITKSGKRVPTWFFMPSQSKKRQTDRERTFQGIAEAMAQQWTIPAMIQTKILLSE